MTIVESVNQVNIAYAQFGQACARAAIALNVFGSFIHSKREEWITIYPGQWPDKFTLLNRYVRTGLQPPFIFND